MKHVAFFITHKTLTVEHADLTFRSFAEQAGDDMFDRLYLYNTHEYELSDSVLLELYNKYELNKKFKDVIIFPYSISTDKSLGGDINAIKEYVKDVYNRQDRVLIIKSDSLLSKNYFKDIFALPADEMVYFVAPFVCAKKRIPNEEILEYIKRDRFIQSDDITFFVEDQFQSNATDFAYRPSVKVTDEQIKFTSCYVVRDFSCHLISVGLFDRIFIEQQSWGGVKFYNLIPFLKETNNSFVVHKYHDIISENRADDREGPVKEWLNS